MLNIENRVCYGTFDRKCKGVINAGGEIRIMARDLILHNKKPKPEKQEEIRVYAIIVDKVDVLFSRELYGQAYVRASKLANEHVTTLVLSIWESARKQFILATCQFCME